MKHSDQKYRSANSRYFRFSYIAAVAFATTLAMSMAPSATAQRGGGHGHGGGHASGGHFAGGHAGSAARPSAAASHGMRVTYLPANSSRASAQASTHAATPGARPFRGPITRRTPVAGNFYVQRMRLRNRNGFFPRANGFLPFGYGFGANWGPDCDLYPNYANPNSGCNSAQGYVGAGYDGQGYAEDDSDSVENAPRPMVIFYTRDGNGYGANDYWQQDGVVHLATTAGSEKTFPMSELDSKKTAEENAARGVYFTLFNTPLAETGPQIAAVTYTAPTCGGASKNGATSSTAGTIAHFGAAGDASSSGVLVKSVQPGSLALQAGIHAGDTVTRIGCQDVHSSTEIDSAIAANTGETLWVSYLIQGSWLSEKPVKMR